MPPLRLDIPDMFPDNFKNDISLTKGYESKIIMYKDATHGKQNL